MRVFRAAVVPHPAGEMFALADDIESYPQFLPWCESASADRDGETVRGRLVINYRGLRTSFATVNRHIAPTQIEMRLADGPLSELSGRWRFSDLGDGRSRVEFEAQWGFRSRTLERLFAGLFRAVFSKFVDAFVARADSLRPKIRAEVVFAAKDGAREWRRSALLPAGATVADALAKVNVAAECSEANVDDASVGVLGEVCNRERVLKDGDRVEIYRPLESPPNESRRARMQREQRMQQTQRMNPTAGSDDAKGV